MKLSKTILTAALLCAPAIAFSQSADEIAKKSHDLPDGNTSSMTAVLTLIDKGGKSRQREVASYGIKEGAVKKEVMVFRTPKDVAGVSYLTFDYPDNADGTPKDSDSWLYLPAMAKSRRVSGSSKDDDFQGTDFTYDDIGNRSLAKDTFALLGQEKVDGADCWILECTAKDKNAKISRRVFWIQKDNYVTRKGEYYDKTNKLKKELKCEDITQISGYWVTKKMTMTNVQTGHKTVFESKDHKFDAPLDKNYFTVSALERELLK